MAQRRNVAKKTRARDGIRLTFENSLLPMLVYDTKTLALVDANRAACEYYGYGREEFLQMRLTDLQAGEEGTEPTQEHSGHLGEGHHRKKSGEIAQVMVLCQPLAAGRRPLAVAVIHSLAFRCSPEMSPPARSETLLDHVTHAVFALDPEGRFTYINRAGAALSGYEPNELLGRPFSLFLTPESFSGIYEQFLNVMHRGALVLRLEVELMRKDGTARTITLNATPLMEAGRITTLVGTAEDITDHKVAQAALRRSEQRYEILADNAPVGIFHTDASGNCLYVNQRWCQIAGLTRQEALGEGWIHGLHPLDVERVFEEWYRAAMENRPFRSEYRFQRADGTVTWVVGQASAERDADGRLTGYVGTITDITARREMEEALRLSEAGLAKAQEIAHVGSWDWDIANDRLTWSKESHRIFGWPLGDTPTYRQFLNAFHPDDRENVQTAVEEALFLDKPYSLEARICRPDGSVRILRGEGEVAFDANRRPIRMVGTMQDITERRRAENALRESEERFRNTFDHAAVGIAHVAPNGHWLMVNQRLCDMLGYSRQELMQRPFAEITHPDDAAADQAMAEKLYAGEVDRFILEKRYIRKDGSPVWVSLNVSLLRDEQSRPHYSICVIQDITKRKSAEAALDETERRWQLATAAMAEGVVIQSADGTTRACNPSAERILELTSEQIKGLAPVDPEWRTIHEDGSPFPREEYPIAVTLRTGQSRSGVVMGVRKPDGTVTWLSINSEPLYRDGQPRPYAAVSTFTDITASKLAEERLRAQYEFREKLMESATNAIFALDLEGRFVLINRAGVDITGYALDEMIGREFSFLYEERELQRVRRQFTATAVSGTPVTNFQTVLTRKNGERRTVVFSISPIREDGRIVGIVGTAEDQTEQRRTYEALHKSQAGLARAQQMAHLGSWEMDVATKTIEVSDETARIFGRQPKQLRTFDDFLNRVHPDDRQRVVDEIETTRREGTPGNMDYRIVGPDGTERIVHDQWELLKDDRGFPVTLLGTVQDITDRKRSEALSTRLGRILDNSFNEIYMFDAQTLLFTHVSQGALRNLGYDMDAMSKMAAFEIKDMAEARFRELIEPLRTGQVDQLVFTANHRRRDGSCYPVEVRLQLSTAEARPVFAAIVQDVSERKAAMEAFRSLNQRNEMILDAAGEGIYGLDLQGKTTFVNPAAAKMLGYEEQELIGRPMHAILHHSRTDGSPHPVTECPIHATIGGAGASHVADDFFWNRDGQPFPVEYTSTPIIEEDGVTGAVVVFRDISQRKRQEALLAGEKQVLEMIAKDHPLPLVLETLAKVFEGQCDGREACSILLLDADGLHLRLGAAPSLPDDYNRAIDGIAIGPDVGSCGAAAYRREMVVVEDISSDPLWRDFRDLALDQGLRSCWSMPILSSKGKVLGTFAIYSREPRSPGQEDLLLIERATHLAEIAIAKKQTETALTSMAYHDALTGLPNRILLRDRLDQVLVRSRRYNRLAAVLFLDLDRFKHINDTLGHDTGDLLLKVVGERLKGAVREEDTVARQGGDEFVVVLDEIVREPDASVVAEKILQILAEPIALAGQELFITASIGISLFPRDGDDPQTLLKNADAAMYRAKEQGRNNFQFYVEAMNAKALQRLVLTNQLRHALERQEFRLYYQPQVDLRTGKIVGAEALLRWQHPELGLVSPAEFIPLLEETGLILPVGDWVLRTACNQHRAWQQAGFDSLRVAVNLSSRQFKQENLLEMVDRALADSGLEPRHLELELTESLVMHDVDETIATLTGLQKMGVSVSVDDFGTGYSGLSYLKRFPINAIKIDKSFVDGIAAKAEDQAIVSAIITMAHSLRLKVIAEGVETEDQVRLLCGQGCDEMQGYFFSRPLPAEAMLALLERGHDLPKRMGCKKHKKPGTEPRRKRMRC